MYGMSYSMLTLFTIHDYQFGNIFKVCLPNFPFVLKLSYRNKSNFIGHLWLGKCKEKKILKREEK